MKKDKRKKPRWLQMIRAFLGGYFWLPCPICGEYFGGHEWGGNWYRGGGSGSGVCVNCVEEAERRSELAYAREPHLWGRPQDNLPLYKHHKVGEDGGLECPS